MDALTLGAAMELPPKKEYRRLKLKTRPSIQLAAHGPQSEWAQPTPTPRAVLTQTPDGTLKGTARIQHVGEVVGFSETATARFDAALTGIAARASWVGSVAIGTTLQDESKAKSDMARINAFLIRLYALGRHGEDLAQRRLAIDESLRYFNSVLNEESFQICDETMRRIDIERIPSSVMVSILGITLPGKTQLHQRHDFFLRVYAEIARLKGRKYANELLTKYR